MTDKEAMRTLLATRRMRDMTKQERESVALAALAWANAEQQKQELDRWTAFYDAALPFVKLVATTSGRIPTEQLSFADWHELCKAFNACTPIRYAAPPQDALDAKRYRWLRNNCSDDLKGRWFFRAFPSYAPFNTYPDRSGLDAAIDAAMHGKGG